MLYLKKWIWHGDLFELKRTIAVINRRHRCNRYTSHSCTTYTVYPKQYAHGFCFAVLCCGYTLTDFPISIRLTSLALWQSNDCPSASKGTLMNMDKYFMWIHYERLHNHNKAKHNKTVCIFIGIYCIFDYLCHSIWTAFKHCFHPSGQWWHNDINATVSVRGSLCLAVPETHVGPTVYPKKYTHGFVVLCFVVVMQSFIMNSHEVFIHIHRGCFHWGNR